MLSETFISSIRAQPKSAIAKDVGIYFHELDPAPKIKSSFKKSSTPVNALAANPTHIFAAQADKAVVHVYSRERGNQEALISFPERIHCLTLIEDVILVLGTAEGRLIFWEVCTGRQISTPASHLQAVSCVAATQSHLISGSEDSNIHVWSIPRLLSLTAPETHEPLRTLPNHRAAITSVGLGHSKSTTNICVSASEDNTIIVWNYHSGTLLRTFLLAQTPLCLAIDSCDRGVFIGFEDGSVQRADLVDQNSGLNPLYDTNLQATPVQVTNPPFVSRSTELENGATNCIGLNHDGTKLLTGHTSGKVIEWDTGRQCYTTELADLNAPVTNLCMISPFSSKKLTKAITIVKPKLAEGNYTFTAQLTSSLGRSRYDQALESQGFPVEMLEDAISRFSSPIVASSSDDEKLRKDNDDLRKVVSEQQALLKKMLAKQAKQKA
ncbi:WD repeat protein-like protein [Calycina marina]|uniref:Pre-rRNA-processing protein IPI3 n=1 Tax=Calycina marina TaxID=1763456 RepID=A0A9P8CBB6_9HELO|nr:WD repeat protein-like protein [Calycina marina]